ncbi:MAG: winged helix-turn-helix domain-containing protein [Microgenomates group bacterium]
MSALPHLDNATARKLYLKAHALTESPAGPCTRNALSQLIHRLGFVQVDSINTVARAHHMILWSRKTAYRPDDLKALLEHDRALWEHWTHDASILPTQVFPYWRQRFERDADRLRGNWARWFRDGYEDQFERILTRIQADGPVTSSDVGEGEPRGKGGWWDWHPSKTALEWLWRTGRLAISGRNGFQKVYDLTERVIPAQHLSHPPLDNAAVTEWACASAMSQLGFATMAELQAYWNAVRADEVKDWAREAIRSGRIIEVEVANADGKPKICLALPDILDAKPPGISGNRLRIISPFDPAFRDRKRTEGLFGFHYRIEVFVPEPKRQFGYYVFPILERDRLIARIDVKAFRDESVLRIKALWPEVMCTWTPARQIELEAELHRLAAFAGCDKVEFTDGWLRLPQTAA